MIEENKALVRRFVEEAINPADLESFDRFVRPAEAETMPHADAAASFSPEGYESGTELQEPILLPAGVRSARDRQGEAP